MTSLEAKLEKQQQDLKAGQRLCLECVCVCLLCFPAKCWSPGRWAHPLPTPLSSLWPLDHATLLLHLKHFPVDMRTLACQLAFLQSNGRDRAGWGWGSPVPPACPVQLDLISLCPPMPSGTECCPVSWVDYEGSCYWFSRSGKPWPEAEKYCQLEDAHLVVINSREEQVKPYLSQRQEETLGMQTLGGWVRLVLLFFLT